MGGAAENDESRSHTSLTIKLPALYEQTIQHFMVGSDAGAAKPGEKVLVLLNRSGLMCSS